MAYAHFRRLVLTAVVSVVLATSGCSNGSSSNASSPTPTASGSSKSSSTGATATTSPTQGHVIPAGTLIGTILFTKAGGRFQDETVFTARADGSHVRRVTPEGTQCCPTWASDGTHILISAGATGGRITTGVLDPSGRQERRLPLTEPGLNLACSGAQNLAGQRLVCEGWSDASPGRNGVYSVDERTGGQVVRLTHAPAGEHDRPMATSSGGKRVYFFRPVTGFPFYGDDLEGSIYAVTADGKDLMRVTPARLPVEVVGNSGGRLSYDGSWIVFTSSGVIWKVRSNGTQLTRLFKAPDGSLAITPTWSPDGRLILFGLDPPGSRGTTNTAPANVLVVIRSDGSDATPVVGNADFKREPDWTG
jgi:Tol biopolymer transport system component